MAIFVAIAAYCEPHLEYTLRDAVRNARYPKNLVFGIVDQSPDNNKKLLQDCLGEAKLRYLHVVPEQSRGLNWARSLAFGLYADETFLLQIDSHTVFDEDWDQILIKQLVDLAWRHEKPIISTYPRGFQFDISGEAIKDDPIMHAVAVIRPTSDSSLKENDVQLSFMGEYIDGNDPLPGCHIAGGFLFTLGNFINELPYDPQLYQRDEQSMAIRAFTHGWNIFHTAHVPLAHLYKEPGELEPSLHWHPDWEALREVKYYVQMYRAQQRFADLVYGRRSLGRYGLGNVRDLEAFARLSGIDYARRLIVPPYQANGYFGA